ncbi:P-loop containing nucleoside triphosphate hydrolase protein [Chytriomyces sp. MP71]|nr:P-loop containing nucleoside triphosphate hydrolase protein [Chytriomyces sp. MP71]
MLRSTSQPPTPINGQRDKRPLPRHSFAPDPNLPNRKLVIVGDGACGKTCLLVMYARQEFPRTYVPTVFENYVANVWIEEVRKVVPIALWDTAGQEDYDYLRPMSYDDANVVLIAYSVDNPRSYENVTLRWFQEVRYHCPNAPIILVALKTDLRSDSETVAKLGRLRQFPISTQEGLHLASQIGAQYVECSALTGHGVNEVFQLATRATHC